MTLGAVLFQRVQGEEWPIAYARHKFTGAETHYSMIERECLVIKWGIELFRYYLMGRKFILITDLMPHLNDCSP